MYNRVIICGPNSKLVYVKETMPNRNDVPENRGRLWDSVNPRDYPEAYDALLRLNCVRPIIQYFQQNISERYCEQWAHYFFYIHRLTRGTWHQICGRIGEEYAKYSTQVAA